MNKEELINFIKQNNGVEIPVLQKQFKITYREAKEFIEELVKNGDLVYKEGLKYLYLEKEVPSAEAHRAELERRRDEVIRKIQGGDEHVDCNENEDEEAKYEAERRKYLELRRQELIRRMQADMEAENDEEDDDDNDDAFEADDDEMDEDELRYKALKLCVENNSVSTSMFQRSFPIGYIRACKLIDWMENEGYISKGDGSKPRKVLITRDEFEEIFSEDDDEIDKLFDALDLSDDETVDEEAEDSNDKLNYLQADKNVKTVNLLESIDSLKGYIKKSKNTINEISDEFVQFFGERAALLIASDLNMSKSAAIKKAQLALEDVRKTGDKKALAVYERIFSELQTMSNYYYNKIRTQLS